MHDTAAAIIDHRWVCAACMPCCMPCIVVARGARTSNGEIGLQGVDCGAAQRGAALLRGIQRRARCRCQTRRHEPVAPGLGCQLRLQVRQTRLNAVEDRTEIDGDDSGSVSLSKSAHRAGSPLRGSRLQACQPRRAQDDALLFVEPKKHYDIILCTQSKSIEEIVSQLFEELQNKL